MAHIILPLPDVFCEQCQPGLQCSWFAHLQMRYICCFFLLCTQMSLCMTYRWRLLWICITQQQIRLVQSKTNTHFKTKTCNIKLKFSVLTAMLPAAALYRRIWMLWTNLLPPPASSRSAEGFRFFSGTTENSSRLGGDTASQTSNWNPWTEGPI